MIKRNASVLSLLILTFAGTISRAQQSTLTFNVIFKDDVVGRLTAVKKTTGPKIVTDLHIESETRFLFLTIQMESEVATTEENGILLEGTAYRNANRILHDIHAIVHRQRKQVYEIERNGKKRMIKGKDITVCISDLYFSEPVGIDSVFSNMYAALLPVEQPEGGKYRVKTPDNNDSFFTYKDGNLISVEVDTMMGKIFSRRR